MKKYNFGVNVFWLILLVSFFVTTDVLTVNIGESYEGGKVAYILQAGDTGYDVSKQKGLIVPTNDQSTAIQWYNGGNFITGVTDSAIGSGNINTESLISVLGVGSYAAMTCYNLNLNGYSDWYLPSQLELYKLFASQDTVGGYANASYWSSTENGVTWARAYNFFNGGLVSGNKSSAYHVRCVRSFTVIGNVAPTVTFLATPHQESTGIVSTTISVSDINLDLTSLVIQYSNNNINWRNLTPSLVTLNQGSVLFSNGSITDIDTGAGGSVNLSIQWDVSADIPKNNDYPTAYIRIIPNDGVVDGMSRTSNAFIIDTKDPTSPGNLTVNNISSNSVTLNFGLPAVDTNFSHYKIYYKTGVTGVDESYYSVPDNNLNSINFNGRITTTIDGLIPDTDYVVRIWAYDYYGNKAMSASELTFKTTALNNKPVISNPMFSPSSDGSGVVSVRFLVTDIDQNIVKLKVQYEPGACNYSGTENFMTITGVTSDRGAPSINVDNYQIQGISAFPTNNVILKWSSKSDIPDVNAIVCVYFTANDGIEDGLTTFSQITVDNLAPTAPGDLSLFSASKDSLGIKFGALSGGNNFDKYKIFYKSGLNNVTENDVSLVNTHLNSYNFDGTTTTVVANLLAETDYVFNIWAYDIFGNKSNAVNELRARTLSQTQNNPPMVTVPAFNVQRDGSGQVRIHTIVSDPEQGNIKLKIQYAVAPVSPAPCSYTGTENILNILSATTSNGVLLFAYGNDYVLQNISTVVNNQVEIKWNSNGDLYGNYGDYCVFITPNDGVSDGFTVSDRVTIDNFLPAIPGNLSSGEVSSNSVELNFGIPTIEANFDRYKIFYKQGLSGVTESDVLVDDSHLRSINFGGFTNTTISGLLPNTDYVFRIWAYDTFGNKSWSVNELRVKTLGNPPIVKQVILTPASIFNSFNFFHRYFFGW